MSEERRGDFSDADIDREFAAIVQQAMGDTAADAENADPVDRDRYRASVGAGKPTWYLVPLRMVTSMVFFMTLSLCIAAHGGVMHRASWSTATLISLCAAVGVGVCRRVAKARYDRHHR